MLSLVPIGGDTSQLPMGRVILGLRLPAAALTPQPSAGEDLGSRVPAGWLRKATAGCRQSKVSDHYFAGLLRKWAVPCGFLTTP
jgi:hypothetical protein